MTRLFEAYFVLFWFLACTSWGAVNYLAVTSGYLSEVRLFDSLLLIVCCLLGAFSGYFVLTDKSKRLQVFAAASLFVLMACAFVGLATFIFSVTGPDTDIVGGWAAVGYFFVGFFTMAASSWGVLMTIATLSRGANRFLRRSIQAFPFVGGKKTSDG